MKYVLWSITWVSYVSTVATVWFVTKDVFTTGVVAVLCTVCAIVISIIITRELYSHSRSFPF